MLALIAVAAPAQADARDRLSLHEARAKAHALGHFDVRGGFAGRYRVRGCVRRDRTRVRCTIREWGQLILPQAESDDPANMTYVAGALDWRANLYLRRDGLVGVRGPFFFLCRRGRDTKPC